MANYNADALAAAGARRSARAEMQKIREEWFIDKLSTEVNRSVEQRVMLATEFLKNKIIVNISKPVKKQISNGKTVVIQRSKPGEFPRADTTQLMKTIFSAYSQPSDGVYDGYVGTPIGYGLRLELFMERSFFIRTLNDLRSKIEKVLSGPVA